jgi:Ca2+-binding EF-hand superfamily protein
VDRIWRDLEKTSDGHLTLDETKEFIKLSFGQNGELPYSEDVFRQIFFEIDNNHDGKISKGEMV